MLLCPFPFKLESLKTTVWTWNHNFPDTVSKAGLKGASQYAWDQPDSAAGTEQPLFPPGHWWKHGPRHDDPLRWKKTGSVCWTERRTPNVLYSSIFKPKAPKVYLIKTRGNKTRIRRACDNRKQGGARAATCLAKEQCLGTGWQEVASGCKMTSAEAARATLRQVTNRANWESNG